MSIIYHILHQTKAPFVVINNHPEVSTQGMAVTPPVVPAAYRMANGDDVGESGGCPSLHTPPQGGHMNYKGQKKKGKRGK